MDQYTAQFAMIPRPLLIFLFAASPLLSWAGGTTYSAGETWGTVIDAESKQPISGALVIALWDLEGGSHRDVTGTFQVLEAVTAQDGSFRMPSWGPLPRPKRGVLDGYDPQLLVIKNGYQIKRVFNPPEAANRRAYLDVHNFAMNGTAIAMSRFQLAPQVYAMDIGSAVVGGILDDVLSGCAWKKIPKTVRYLVDEGKREKAAGLLPLRPVTVERLLAKNECAPTDEFMKMYNNDGR